MSHHSLATSKIGINSAPPPPPLSGYITLTLPPPPPGACATFYIVICYIEDNGTGGDRIDPKMLRINMSIRNGMNCFFFNTAPQITCTPYQLEFQ